MPQDQFAQLFDLKKTNINSYENGTIPQTLKFIEIMDHFGLDPSKFIHLDMEKHSVSKDDVIQEQEIEAIAKSGGLDLEPSEEFIKKTLPPDWEKMRKDELKEAYQKQHKMNLILLKNDRELKKENKRIQDKYIELLERIHDSEEGEQ